MAKENRKQESTESRVTPKERRHRSRQTRKDRQFILIGSAAAALAVVLILTGVLYTLVYQPNTAAFTVNGQKVTTAEFRKRYNYERANMENRWQFYRMVESQFGAQPQTQVEINRLGNYLRDAFSLGVFVKTQMIEDILLAQEASAEGVAVSDQEVEMALEREVANRYGKVTAAAATATVEAAEEQARMQAEAGEVTSSSPDPDVLTATDIEQGLQGIAAEMKADYNLTLEEYREIMRAGLLRQALSVEIGERELTLTERQVNPRHILLGFDAEDADSPTYGRTEIETLDFAAKLLDRLHKGESFGYLATQYSDDPSAATNEGDLGWVRKGLLVTDFEEVAFSLSVGDLSDPVKSDFGYHIIQVMEENPDADRPSDEIQAEATEKFNEWLQTLRDEAQIEERGNLTGQLPAGAEQASVDFAAR
jgi:parvulin-like peptidyl-prolyl isomerase